MAPVNPGTDNLISWWDLDESSGSRADSHGSNTLTDHNTVGSATGKLSNAADFVSANSEALYRADNADLSFGDDDFTITAWVYLDTTSSAGTVAGKWHGSSGREYVLSYLASGINRFRMLVSPTGSSTVEVRADTFGTPSTGTWYFVVCWHDKTANQIGISVNDGTADTTSHSTGVNDGTNEFVLGSGPRGSFELDGRLDEVGLWDKVLSGDEIEWLYNSGNGRTYDNVVGLIWNFTTAIAASTATPDDVILANAVSTSSTGTIASNTSGTAALIAAVSMSSSATIITVTSDTDVIRVYLSSAAITAATTTPDTVAMVSLSSMISAVTAVTATSDVVILDRTMDYSGAITAASSTPDTLILRNLLPSVSAVTAATTTPDTVAVAVSRALVSAITAPTAISSSVLAINRTFVSSGTATTVTPDTAAFGLILSYVSAITSATATNDSVAIDIYLHQVSSSAAGTSTSAPSMALTANMTSSATIASNTSTFALLIGGRILVMAFTGRRPGQTMTVRQ